MADLSITAAQVRCQSVDQLKSALAGEAITAGEPLYRVGSTVYLADANDTEVKARVCGIAVHDAALGQVVAYQEAGDIVLGAGAAMTVGVVYVLATTAGGICPLVDIATSDDYLTILGIASTASTLKLNIWVTAVQIP